MGIKEEIKEISKDKGITDPAIIEKDYVISWILRRLWVSGAWKSLIFKGGTALKKVYFPDYRFSEDMDFNLLGGEAELEIIRQTLENLTDGKGRSDSPAFMDVSIKEKEGRKYNPGKIVGYEIRIPYRLLRAGGEPAKIKMDLSVGRYEKTLLPPEERPIIHNYSDYPAFSRVKVMAYSLEEIMAEKIRTIFQREGRPRDIYDIWYLSSRADMERALSIVQKKFEEKKMDFSDERLENTKDAFESNWGRMAVLAEDVPEFEEVWKAVETVCGRAEKVMRSGTEVEK